MLKQVLAAAVLSSVVVSCGAKQSVQSSDLSSSLVGTCFKFEGTKSSKVGPVALFEPAENICVVGVNAMGGRKYWSVSFSDKKGDLAQLASQIELRGRCFTNFCNSYVLTSGNSNGKNVDPDSTAVNFHTQDGVGTVTFNNEKLGSVTHKITQIKKK